MIYEWTHQTYNHDIKFTEIGMLCSYQVTWSVLCVCWFSISKSLVQITSTMPIHLMRTSRSLGNSFIAVLDSHWCISEVDYSAFLIISYIFDTFVPCVAGSVLVVFIVVLVWHYCCESFLSNVYSSSFIFLFLRCSCIALVVARN